MRASSTGQSVCMRPHHAPDVLLTVVASQSTRDRRNVRYWAGASQKPGVTAAVTNHIYPPSKAGPASIPAWRRVGQPTGMARGQERREGREA
eukprot:scaffold2782_cov328-Prasinococcus_capsulatus_cf.AAC.4